MPANSATTNEAHILLVEDSRHDAELTVRALSRYNLANNLIHVRDGAEALDWLHAKGIHAERDLNLRPKVILLDMKLPKMDGLEVLSAIRKDETWGRIPVVVLTSSKEEQDVVRSYALGASSYIIKPVDFDSFSAAVADVGNYWLQLNTVPR